MLFLNFFFLFFVVSVNGIIRAAPVFVVKAPICSWVLLVIWLLYGYIVCYSVMGLGQLELGGRKWA